MNKKYIHVIHSTDWNVSLRRSKPTKTYIIYLQSRCKNDALVWIYTSKNTLAAKSIKSSVLINEKWRNAAYTCPKTPSDKPKNVCQQEWRDWRTPTDIQNR